MDKINYKLILLTRYNLQQRYKKNNKINPIKEKKEPKKK